MRSHLAFVGHGELNNKTQNLGPAHNYLAGRSQVEDGNLTSEKSGTQQSMTAQERRTGVLLTVL